MVIVGLFLDAVMQILLNHLMIRYLVLFMKLPKLMRLIWIGMKESIVVPI